MMMIMLHGVIYYSGGPIGDGITHKGSVQRAADNARYARARKNATKKINEGGRKKKRPMISCD